MYFLLRTNLEVGNKHGARAKYFFPIILMTRMESQVELQFGADRTRRGSER